MLFNSLFKKTNPIGPTGGSCINIADLANHFIFGQKGSLSIFGRAGGGKTILFNQMVKILDKNQNQEYVALRWNKPRESGVSERVSIAGRRGEWAPRDNPVEDLSKLASSNVKLIGNSPIVLIDCTYFFTKSDGEVLQQLKNKGFRAIAFFSFSGTAYGGNGHYFQDSKVAYVNVRDNGDNKLEELNFDFSIIPHPIF